MSAVRKAEAVCSLQHSQPSASLVSAAGQLPAASVEQANPVQYVLALVVARDAASGICQLSCDGRAGSTLEIQAKSADGLLLVPELNDQVLCVKVADDWLVSQILLRATGNTMQFASQRPIEWLAPRIKLSALRDLELLSAGKLSCYSVDMVVGISRTLMQQARHLIQQAGDFTVTAKGLLRLNGKQQLITAQEDVRVDGKRISMG